MLVGIEPIIPERLYGEHSSNLGNMLLVGVNWVAFTVQYFVNASVW